MKFNSIFLNWVPAQRLQTVQGWYLARSWTAAEVCVGVGWFEEEAEQQISLTPCSTEGKQRRGRLSLMSASTSASRVFSKPGPNIKTMMKKKMLYANPGDLITISVSSTTWHHHSNTYFAMNGEHQFCNEWRTPINDLDLPRLVFLHSLW